MKIKLFKIFVILITGLIFIGCNQGIINTNHLETKEAALNRASIYNFIIIYEHSNYQGEKKFIYTSDGVANLGTFKNRVSSMKVYGNTIVTLYSEENQKGIYTQIINDDVSNFNDIAFNDLACSVSFKKPNKQTHRVSLYKEPNFRGPSLLIDYRTSAYNISAKYNYLNNISSVKVDGDATVTLYSGKNLTGDFIQVSDRNIPDLKVHKFDNKIASVSFMLPTKPYVIVYDNRDYSGDFRVFSHDVTNLSYYGFNDKMSSIRTFNNKKVNLHRHNYLESSNITYYRGNKVLSDDFDNAITLIDIQ